VSSKYLNTITNHSQCTVVFAVIVTFICWFCSLPRTFSALSRLATASAFFTFISVLLAAIFAGIEAHPQGYNPDPNYVNPVTGIHGGEPIVTAIPVKGTTFVAGMNAFLNISYTFIGQITLPSFIAEMRNPRDFPKALWVVTICEILVFGCIGAVVYAYTGNQYNTSPAFGSLGNEVFKKVSFSFMIPTLIFLGVLYASVSARFIFFRIFEVSTLSWFMNFMPHIDLNSWCLENETQVKSYSFGVVRLGRYSRGNMGPCLYYCKYAFSSSSSVGDPHVNLSY